MLYHYIRPSQEAQKIFKTTSPMENASIKTKLLGFGMQLLEGIDPNPDNFVCAAIIHTRTQQIGCLLRLEPNRQAQVKQHSTVLPNFILYYSPILIFFLTRNVLYDHYTRVLTLVLSVHRCTVSPSGPVRSQLPISWQNC